MANDLTTAWDALQESAEYKEFLQDEEGYRLVHAYTEEENGQSKPWEFGFYNEQRDRMIVFHTEPLRRGEEEEIFKHEGVIKPLDMSTVSIGLDRALEICEQQRKEKYITQLVMKRILILQSLHKQVWNVTMLTRTFHIINLKIDAQSGEILSSNMSSVMDLGLRKI